MGRLEPIQQIGFYAPVALSACGNRRACVTFILRTHRRIVTVIAHSSKRPASATHDWNGIWHAFPEVMKDTDMVEVTLPVELR